MPYTAYVSPIEPAVASYLVLGGHSFFQQPVSLGATLNAITPDQSGEIGNILAAALNLTPASVRNIAMTAAQIVQPGKYGSGFARILTDITRKRATMPFLRSGGTHIGCYGLNDAGNNTFNAALQNEIKHGLRLFISKARAAANYFAAVAGGPWSFGTNFTAATAATYTKVTSGQAIRATVIDSAGTSTATFRIPLGYQGESLAFAISGANGATGCDITWGGTITGTTGIVGTVTTTDSVGIGGYGILCVRFTAAANGLSSSNAGQTITLKVTRVSSGGECIIDSAWIEPVEPNPVVMCNQPRLACRNVTLRVGDLTLTSGSTTATSNVAAFASGSDAGNTIVQVSGTAALPAGTTIASVTNATTVVLSQAATASATIVADFNRTLNGYKQYSTNTNFANATPANHAAADADIATLNGLISTVVGEFDTMVTIADLDTAMGAGDTVRASNVFTYFAFVDGLHPNELGNARCAAAIFDAIARLQPVDRTDLGELEMVAMPVPLPGPIRRPRRSGGVYLPEHGGFNTASYTAVAGDMFAIPFAVTEWGEIVGQMWVLQTNAPATAGSNVRWGVYEDSGWNSYPGALYREATVNGGAVAMGTTAVNKALTNMGWHIRPGEYHMVMKIDSLGTTASQFAQLNGPSPYMQSWDTAASATLPTVTAPRSAIGWKTTGQAAGALPDSFPAGATAVNSAPMMAIQIG